MSSGGARAISGPPPDPNALRRDRDHDNWVRLPLRRDGDAPEWPLTKPTARELTIWADLWTMPQAIMWERDRQFIEVALYVRTLREAEAPKASANLRTLVRQQMEALGLSQPGLARNRWRIEAPPSTQAPKRAAVSEGSIRDRFNVITGTG